MPRRELMTLGVLLSGCSQLLGVHELEYRDAMDDPDMSVPMDAPSPPCRLDQPFSTPTLIASANVNTASSDTVLDVSPDELTLYIHSNAGVAQGHVFQLTRASKLDAWGPRQEVYVSNPDGNSIALSVLPSGLRAVVASDRMTILPRLYLIERTSTSGSFTEVSALSTLNSTQSDNNPRFNSDATLLYFDSNRSPPMNVGTEIYVSRITGNVFGAPTVVDELSSIEQDSAVVLTADDRTAYLRLNGDVHVSTRTDRAMPWGPVTPVTELNGPEQEWPGAVSADGCHLYINRISVSDFGIWYSEKPPL